MALFDDVKEVVVEQLNVTELYEPESKPKKIYTPSPEVVSFLSRFTDIEQEETTSNIEELVEKLEKKFNISIPDDQAEAITSVSDAIKFIENV